jgi:hypothetical protein
MALEKGLVAARRGPADKAYLQLLSDINLMV